MHPSIILDAILAGFIVGSFISFVFKNFEPQFILIFITFLLVFIFARSARRSFIAIIFVLFCWMGYVRFSAQYFKESEMDEYDNQEVILVGYIPEYPGLNQFKIHATSVHTDELCSSISEDVLVKGSADDLKIGKTYIATGKIGKLKSRRSSLDPSYLLKAKEITELSTEHKTKPSNYIKEVAGAIRGRVSLSLTNAIPEPAASLARGYLIGGSSGLPDEVIKNFRRLSLTHILAVSGYNVTIVVIVIMSAATLFLKRAKATLFSCLGITLFSFVAGLSASVVRASFMGIFMIISSAFGRIVSPARVLIITGSVMALFSPLAPFYDIGFQLSFLAVAGLLYIVPVLEKRLGALEKVPGLKESLSSTLAAQIAVSPLIAYYFGSLSIMGILANLLITPLIPYVMAISALVILVSPMNSFLSYIVGVPAYLIGKMQIKISSVIASLPFSSVGLKMNLVWMISFYLFLIFVVIKLRTSDQ